MEFGHVKRTISRDVRYTLALVLAGGKGRRLHDLTRWRVKPAVPFGGKYRLIDFVLSNCVNSGLRRIGVLTQYKAQSLIRHISQGWSLLQSDLDEFIEILPAQQRLAEVWYAGTADAVYQNIDTIRLYNPEFVLVLAGDHVYKMDYATLVSFHSSHGADVTIVCTPVPIERACSFGVMRLNEKSQVIAFEEKPDEPTPMSDDPTKALVSMGIYVFNPEYLYGRLVDDAGSTSTTHDFGKDIIPTAIEVSSVFAYRFDLMEEDYGSYWRDVGTVDSYWLANMELIGVHPPLNLYDQRWPIRTTIHQLPPAKFVLDEDGRRGHAIDSLVGEGAIVSGAHVEDSLISRDVRVEERSNVMESVVLPAAEIGPDCKIRKAVIDKGCNVPAGTEIGFDREKDEAHFHVTCEGVTLVTPDMLGQRIHRVG